MKPAPSHPSKTSADKKVFLGPWTTLFVPMPVRKALSLFTAVMKKSSACLLGAGSMWSCMHLLVACIWQIMNT